MFDDGGHRFVALSARQQCDTEVNLGIGTCSKFICFFFVKMKQMRRMRSSRDVVVDLQKEPQMEIYKMKMRYR